MGDEKLKNPLFIDDPLHCNMPFRTVSNEVTNLPASEVAKVDMRMCCDNGSDISYGDAYSRIKDLEQEIIKLKQERDAYIDFLNEIIFRPIRNFAKRADTQYLATCIAEGIKNGDINCEGSVQKIWYDHMPGKRDPYYVIEANYVLRTKK